ncbi:hypothetical protein OESDEN_03307 [Oesophagostomum dentatum]|uniref:BZIP domain-containing protein n=1 Tax=Oesophagostomum dentatum TaxID=61180 RepID=A0A0B1TKW8_OESDE|nr:hypothetical protein OESDEN_03307 [Oesophagostomum dentatum]
MLCDIFRSESEERSSTSLSDCVREIRNPEAVVFYSPQYEEDLLMKYLGESSTSQSVDECSSDLFNYDPLMTDDCMLPSYGNIDPTHSPISLEGDALFYEGPPMDSTTLMAKVEEEQLDEKPTSRLPSPRYDPIKKPSRRGRPMKITSTSKMANYARNYREQKKMQLATYEAQVKQLTEENERLRAENQRLTEGFERLSRQVESLRRVLESSSYPVHDPLRTPFASPPMHQKNIGDDVYDFSDLITFPQ